MAAGNPSACPSACARCDLAYLVKSGIFSATVAQNPTIPVSEGIKNFPNSPNEWNLLGALSTGPSPPALPVIHQSRSNPTPSIRGALTLCRNLIVSIPRQITVILTSQKAKKQTQTPTLIPAEAGHRICSIE